VDLEVYAVTGQPIQIRGTKPFTVQCYDIFPVVEAIFGPLRVPILRSPEILDKEYGNTWRSSRRVKTGGRHGSEERWRIVPDNVKRLSWPSVELRGCPSLQGGYVGAGLEADSSDQVWRCMTAHDGDVN
jgi:hypothetical protein